MMMLCAKPPRARLNIAGKEALKADLSAFGGRGNPNSRLPRSFRSLAMTIVKVSFPFSFTFIFFLSCQTLWALEVPSRPEGYVTDLAGLLSPAAKARLETLLHQQEIQTSNQVVILTLPTLAGDSLEDFSIRLAEKWKIGQKGKDNGIIFLISKEDRQMRIEVGYGLEGVLPDSLAGAIIRNIVVPRFRAGQFEEGVLMGTQAILEAIRGEFKNENPGGTAEDPLLPLFKWIAVAAGLVFLLDSTRYGQYRIFHRAYNERYSFLEWFIRFSILLAVLGGIFRLIFYAMLSSRGGYYGNRSGYSSFPGGSSDGGGFGGGGGGGFGGGGASGSW